MVEEQTLEALPEQFRRVRLVLSNRSRSTSDPVRWPPRIVRTHLLNFVFAHRADIVAHKEGQRRAKVDDLVQHQQERREDDPLVSSFKHSRPFLLQIAHRHASMGGLEACGRVHRVNRVPDPLEYWIGLGWPDPKSLNDAAPDGLSFS